MHDKGHRVAFNNWLYFNLKHKHDYAQRSTLLSTATTTTTIVKTAANSRPSQYLICRRQNSEQTLSHIVLYTYVHGTACTTYSTYIRTTYCTYVLRTVRMYVLRTVRTTGHARLGSVRHMSRTAAASTTTSAHFCSHEWNCYHEMSQLGPDISSCIRNKEKQ